MSEEKNKKNPLSLVIAVLAIIVLGLVITLMKNSLTSETEQLKAREYEIVENYRKAKAEYDELQRLMNEANQPVEQVQSTEEPAGQVSGTSTWKEEPAIELALSSTNPNSYLNFPEAVAKVEECKNNVNTSTFYQDWVNKYGELSGIQMCLITWAESRYDWYAVGDNGDSIGMFQINTAAGHCKKVEGIVGRGLTKSECKQYLYEPAININVAQQLYEAQGWVPWTGRKAYLPSFRVDWLEI